MAAAALTLALGIGSGPEMLRALGTEQEISGKSGGGIYRLTEEEPEKQAEAKNVTEKAEEAEGGNRAQNQTLEADEKELEENQPKTKKKTTKTSGDTAENGQTILDVSQGDKNELY